jgi:hypothetical protein
MRAGVYVYVMSKCTRCEVDDFRAEQFLHNLVDGGAAGWNHRQFHNGRGDVRVLR